MQNDQENGAIPQQTRDRHHDYRCYIINQTQCLVRKVHYCQSSVARDRCQSEAGYYSTAGRTAMTWTLARPVLLQVMVSVHYCDRCRHYMRAQPPFLRRDSIYANEVVRKAVNCVYDDGMAMRRATVRSACDFWVQPSEASIRFWCKQYRAGFDFATSISPGWYRSSPASCVSTRCTRTSSRCCGS